MAEAADAAEAEAAEPLPATGENPPAGVVVYYSLKDKPKGDLKLEFLDQSGKLVQEFSSKADAPARPVMAPGGEGDEETPRIVPPARVTAQQGMNKFIWNMRYPDAKTFPGLIMWAAGVQGPRISPGSIQCASRWTGKRKPSPSK